MIEKYDGEKGVQNLIDSRASGWRLCVGDRWWKICKESDGLPMTHESYFQFFIFVQFLLWAAFRVSIGSGYFEWIFASVPIPSFDRFTRHHCHRHHRCKHKIHRATGSHYKCVWFLRRTLSISNERVKRKLQMGHGWEEIAERTHIYLLTVFRFGNDEGSRSISGTVPFIVFNGECVQICSGFFFSTFLPRHGACQSVWGYGSAFVNNFVFVFVSVSFNGSHSHWIRMVLV